MKILAIETSCDETAIAIADFSGARKTQKINVGTSLVSSQIKLHKKFGGVVPNLARREHEKNLVPLLLHALEKMHLLHKKETNKKKKENNKNKINLILSREPELLRQFTKEIIPHKIPDIDALAVTYGPGLAPALWVGVNFSKALAVLWKKPIIPVNHMAGHFYSAFLQKPIRNSKLKIQNPKFPILGLLVSGAHTELILAKEHGKFKIIGETLDDAAGEAFDKVARMMGLSYPGGPKIAREAKKNKNKLMIPFPRPMIKSPDYNFSFSGLKTAVLYRLRDFKNKYRMSRIRPEFSDEFQKAVVDVLIKKTLHAAKTYHIKTILLGGGVAANEKLRSDLAHAINRELPGKTFITPELELTGDNALMIATAAYLVGKKKAWHKIHADANARLGQ